MVSPRDQDQPMIVVGVPTADGSSIDEPEAHQVELGQIAGLALPDAVGFNPASLVENTPVVVDEVA
ncbi:MAG: hypothetical protein V3U47_05390 [Acidimicrobiia bacterium]